MFRNCIKPFLEKKLMFRFWNKLYRVSLLGMNIGTGSGPEISGEKNVLEYISKKYINSKIIIYDIGANKGQYVKSLLQVFNNKMNFLIYCFEPGKRGYNTIKN